MTNNADKRSERLISPRALQLVGLALLVAAFVYWIYTGNESLLFVGAAMSLIGLGSYERAAAQLRDRLDGK